MKKFNLSKGLIVGLLTFALSIVAFAAVGASADEAAQAVTPPEAVDVTFEAGTDSIIGPNGTVVYVLKSGTSAIKASAKCGTIANGKLALADLGVKGVAKDVYLYACNKEFETDATSIKANLVIKAAAAKKIVGVIDYTKADDNNCTRVLSITATDNSKKAIENPSCVWSDSVDGTYKNSSEFTGEVLAKMLSDGGGVIFVKMTGADGATGTAQFNSKVIKVKIGKQAKAPKVKYDPKKDTIALKNGFDFAVATKNNDKYTVSSWYTILPVLKTAKIKTAEKSIVSTSIFKPVNKKDSAANNDTPAEDAENPTVSYTQYKFKTVSMNDVLRILGKQQSDTFILAVRKSATEKKPASEVTYIEFAGQTENPIVYTKSNVKDQYDIATIADFDKKGFTIGTISNFNGVGGTEGYDDSFKLKATATEGADKNAAAYEFCVANVADLETIDWTSVSWKKLDPAKTKITSKLKSKYNTTTKTGIEATLKATAMPEDGLATLENAIPEEVASVLLVRRAGVKGDTPVRPSNYIVLYVIKDGKEYTLFSTRSNGEEAYQYTVEFYSYNPPAEGNVYKYEKDESIGVITGWGKNSSEYVELPKIEGADFFILSDVANGTLGDAAELGSTGAGKDKYEVAVAEENKTVKLAVRKRANVTVTAVFGTIEDEKFTPIKDLTQTLAVVEDGKILTYNNTSKKWEAGEAVVSVWADNTQDTIICQSIVNPTGYIINTTPSLDEESYAATMCSAAVTWNDSAKKVALKVKEGEKLDVELQVGVVPTYTITVDPNGGELKSGYTGKITTDEYKKIALDKFPAAVNLTAPANKELKGFVLDKSKALDAEGNEVTTNTVFSANTIIYAVWGDPEPEPNNNENP